MRPQGAVSSSAGLAPFAHVGWGYRDRVDFDVRVGEWLADGIAANQRIEYVGDGSRDALCATLADIGFGDAVKSGRIRAMPIEDAFELGPGGDLVDGEAEVTELVAATEQTLADGYSGLRLVTDSVALVRTAQQRDAWADFEHLLDRRTAVLPLSAFCAYDLTGLGSAAPELICLHPFAAEEAAGFRIFAEPGVAFTLAGEVDAAGNDAFLTALQRVWRLQPPGPLLVEARGLEFITHRQLRGIDDLAGAEKREVVLRTDHRITCRLVSLLELTNVRTVADAPVSAASQSSEI